MDIKTRDMSLTAIFAALYALLVYVFQPISFASLQFRIAGVLRPAISRKWILSIGYAIGVLVGNFFSPFAGIYELLFMPIMSFIAGIIGYMISRKFNNNYFITGLVIATIIPISVSWMLNQIFNVPILTTFPPIFVSEQIICFIGAYLFKTIERRFRWW